MKSLIQEVKEIYGNKFNYYKKLGFSDKVSVVLSVFTYSSSDIRRLDSVKIDSIYKELEKNNNNGESISDFLYDCVYGDDMGYSVKKFERDIGKPTLDALSFGSFTTMSCDIECSDSVAMPREGLNTIMYSESLINPHFIEKLATDRYDLIEEKGFLNVLNNPTSTFRMTTNTASMGIISNNLRKNRRIDMSMVRIEELLNYFKYNLSKPSKRVFNINTEICDKPNSNNKLLFIGVQGKHEIKEKQNIILLLDVSGSMSRNNEVTQAAIATLVSKLNIGDTFSFITYSTKDDTIMKGFKIKSEEDKITILEKLLKLEIHGCTYGSAGIETAYSIGKKYFIENGNNRVILMTDGDLNFGITSKGGLQDLIEEKKKTGIFLSVMGTGLYNYKDDNLEVLSKYGNGTYCVCNDVEDVEESILNNYANFMNAIAKDVKAQVEFNPKMVKEYRLLGYENRMLNHEDFKDDTVISEPFGSDGYGVALYELVMQDSNENIESDLKYQIPTLTDSTDICTVKVRYKEPLGDESNELSVDVHNKDGKLTDNLKLAYSVYIIGEKLRDSKFIIDNGSTVKNYIKEIDSLKEINGNKLDLLRDLVEKIL